MQFAKLTISQWRQYDNVELDLHPRLTVITGANGAGKTTILRILAQHFGWSSTLLATPKKVGAGGTFQYLNGIIQGIRRKEFRQNIPNAVGEITYSNNATSQLSVPESGGIAFGMQIHNIQNVLGLHINSHRPVQSYKQITSIPTNAIGAEHAYQTYFQETFKRYMGTYTEHSPVYRMKEAIISMAIFGPGNSNVQSNPEMERLFTEFKRVLALVLPPTIGFLNISVRIPDVVLVTRTGEFVLDAASGGLMSIIDLSWQIFMFSQGKENFTVTIDEPENHLHPSMQRSLMGRLVDAFPQAQFIVVTHSPFIVTSVKDSYVHVLGYQESPTQETDDFAERKISSLKLDMNSKAATASEVLRNVLGVPVTLPEWAEDDLKVITEGFRNREINSDTLAELRNNLDASGLGEYFPEALKNVMK